MPLQQHKLEDRAQLFGFLSDPTRLKIIHTLYKSKGELCVNDIALAVDASQSATSHQLRKLEMLGIVSKCRYGQEICYCLNQANTETKRIIKLLNQ